MSSRQEPDCEVVVEKQARVGEGAIWDSGKQVLYWVDILGHELYISHPASGEQRIIPTCQAVGAVVPRARGGLVLALHNGFAHLDLESEKITPIADPERDMPANRFNDGKCDPAGRFWAGTMEFEGRADQGSLYCLEIDHRVSRKLSPVSISNGIVWSRDQRTMYYIDSMAGNVRAYDYEVETGAIRNERVVVLNEGEGIFDGMAIDEEDRLWIAVYGGGCVKCYDPRKGELLRELRLPARHITSCAFGGENLDELYVTSARQGLDEEELAGQPLAGSLLRLEPGARGVPSSAYAG